MATIDINDLTSGSVGGNGVFDTLMASVGAHIREEYSNNRIKGTEYATVYLGAIQTVIQTSLTFVLSEAKTEKEIELLTQQIANAALEGEVLTAQKSKLDAECALLVDTVPKLAAETALLGVEYDVRTAQKCKLDAEYDVLVGTVPKLAAETALLGQKKLTEQAQVNGAAVDADSIIGKQKALYEAQTAGYARDAEQKAAKIVADIIGIQMSVTDYEANDTNKITDNYIGNVLAQLYAGIGA